MTDSPDVSAAESGADGRLDDDTALSPALAAALESFAQRETLLVCLDFDGCVAELVADAEAARPVPATARAIDALAAVEGVTVAYVSGRPLATLRRLASPPAGALLIGSHGAEADLRGDPADSGAAGDPSGGLELTPAQQQARAELIGAFEQLAAEVDGAWVEHKPAGAGMHVRRVEDLRLGDELLARAEAAAAGVEGAYAESGKRILEAVVVQATKGEGIERLRARTGAEVVFFAGDDVTDEHGFAVLGEGDLGVKVGDGETAAAHRIAAPADLAAVLNRILRARDGGRGVPPGR